MFPIPPLIDTTPPTMHQIRPELDEYAESLNDAAKDTGWSAESMISVLIQYLEQHDDTSAEDFRTFVNGQADEEVAAGVRR